MTLPPMLIEVPLTFAYDPDTELISVVATGSTEPQKTQNVEVPAFPIQVILRLSVETSRQLLADIPILEKLLEQASRGPTKPDFVQ